MSKALSEFDRLATIRSLPDEIKKDVGVLLVNREGDTDEAFMKTEDFVGYVEPHLGYRLQDFDLVADKGASMSPLVDGVEPPKAKVNGLWQDEVDLLIEDANILGGNGRYLLPEGAKALRIPIAETNQAHLAYYGCQLVAQGEAVQFSSTGPLPLTITTVGKDYAEHYLLKPNYGGGAYLETHDRPHFHMPMESEAGGYLIIGRRNLDKSLDLSAFAVPYGYAILMAPWTVHADSYLVGRYLVVYSVTEDFSTVIIRKASGELAPVEFY